MFSEGINAPVAMIVFTTSSTLTSDVTKFGSELTTEDATPGRFARTKCGPVSHQDDTGHASAEDRRKEFNSRIFIMHSGPSYIPSLLALQAFFHSKWSSRTFSYERFARPLA